MKRNKTVAVHIGNLVCGGNDHIIIQTMLNLKTSKIEKCLAQINNLKALGCELVRVSVLDDADAIALKELCAHSSLPIVADIHFNYNYAITAIDSGVAKIRINPGTIGNKEQLKQIVEKAKVKNVAIRIGFNSGSLPKDLDLNDHSNQEKAILISQEVIKYIKLFESWDFYNIVVSFKSSDFEFNCLVNSQIAKSTNYPIHLGVTEAGSHSNAIIRSVLGLTPLLKDEGIGNTIRISITGSPEQEIIVCKQYLRALNLLERKVEIISCPTCGRCQYDLEPIVNALEKATINLNHQCKVAVMGCVVNGLGEAKGAEITVVGGSNKKVSIYLKGKFLETINEKEVVNKVLHLITTLF